MASDFEWGYVLPREMRSCESDGRGMKDTSYTYRCPKCFKVTKVQN